MTHYSFGRRGGNNHRIGFKQLVQFEIIIDFFDWDHLRNPGEVGRYRDSRKSIGIVRGGVVDGETTEIQNGRETLIFDLDTNKPKVNSNFRSDVVDKAPII